VLRNGALVFFQQGWHCTCRGGVFAGVLEHLP
jgi:hypothetical protein